MSYELLKPYTDIQRADFVCLHQGLTPYENEIGFYFLEENEIVDDEGVIIIDPDYQQKQAQKRQEYFQENFFNTSLGYVRREVNMQDGSSKTFLTDLFPTITIMVNAGQQVPIITYNEPDFTQELTPEYMLTLQNQVIVTPQFIQECALQVSVDFYGIQNEG